MVMMIVIMVVMIVMIVIMIVMMIVIVIVIMPPVWMHMNRQTGWIVGMMVAVALVIGRGRSRGECHSAETDHRGSGKRD